MRESDRSGRAGHGRSRANEHRVALHLVGEVGQDPLLDDCGLPPTGDPVLDALELPAVETARVVEADHQNARLGLIGDRAPESFDHGQRDVRDQFRADDARTHQAASLGAGDAHLIGNAARELQLA